MNKQQWLILGLAVSLIGCASTQQQLADKGDWQAIGYQDGAKGVTARSYKALSQLGEADVSQYQQGYERGNKEYCNADFAYQIGLSGQYYEGVCEGHPDAQKFRMEWQRGWDEFSNDY